MLRASSAHGDIEPVIVLPGSLLLAGWRAAAGLPIREWLSFIG